MSNKGLLNYFLKGFSYSFGTNFISLVIRCAYVFILPRLINVENFGYWQLYFLYSNFIHFCHLGLVDGIYLKYGGCLYSEIDREKICPQFWILVLQGCTFATLVYIGSEATISDENKLYIFRIIAIDIILMLPRTLLSVVFQATGLIRQFSMSLLSQEVIGFGLVIIFLVSGISNYEFIILSDCLARIFSLGLSMYFAADLIKIPRISFADFKIAYENIKIGIFLLIANMASFVTLSVIRIVIEQKWGIITFSKISLALSMANMVMVAISAASVVMYPLLKRVKAEYYPQIYFVIKNGIVYGITFLLVFYYPLTFMLKFWLPQYVDSLKFLGIVAPVCLFEAQLVLLCNNFLNAIRKEKIIFEINIIAVLLAGLMSVIAYIIDIEIDILLWYVVLISIFKVFASEYFLRKELNLRVREPVCVSVATTIVFIATAFYFSDGWGLVIYLGYILCNLRLFKKTFEKIRKLVNSYS